jgi:predicted metal-dependent peptidase
MANILAGKTPEELAKMKLAAAKYDAMYACPFFGYLLLSPEYVQDDSMPTMGTDGHKIYYNHKFVVDLPMKQLIGVMVHEVMHDAFLHMLRKGVRDPAKWNLAADFAVNYLIKNGEGLELPQWICYDEKYKDQSVEEIYADITKNPPPILKVYQAAANGQGPPKDGNGNTPFMDSHIYGNGKDKSHDAMAEQDWKGKLAQAAVFARNQGKLPAGMERLIEETLEQSAPWQQLLRRYLSPFALKTDYTWTKPNKKFLQYDFVMPGYTSDSLEIVVGIDTSGSIGQKEISLFLNEVRAIMGVAKSYTIHIIGCDAAVHDYFKCTEFSGPIPDKIGGGGGTDFRPVFKEIEKRMLHPSVMVYFTDGYGTFPNSPPPGCHTIWAVVPGGIKKDQIPFGTFIPVKFEQE